MFTITDSQADGGILYPVRTFADDMKRLLVVKRPGMEKFSLLDKNSDDDDGSSASLWNSVFSSKSKTKGTDVDEDDDGKIHVLCPGHMYERLRAHNDAFSVEGTSKPVKFWLFENYLSPTFKDIAAVMAEEYGFEVDYVTYDGQGLNQQTQNRELYGAIKYYF